MQVEAGGDVVHLAEEVLPEVRHHGLDDGARRRAGVEFVRIGEEVSLQRFGLGGNIADQFRIAGELVPLATIAAESFLHEDVRNRETVEPLADGDALGHDVAADQLVQHFLGRHRLREFVNAGLDAVVAPGHLHVDQRDEFVADDPLGFEMLEDRGGAQSVAHFDVLERFVVVLVRRAHGAQHAHPGHGRRSPQAGHDPRRCGAGTMARRPAAPQRPRVAGGSRRPPAAPPPALVQA